MPVRAVLAILFAWPIAHAQVYGYVANAAVGGGYSNPYCNVLRVTGDSTLFQCENFKYWENNITGALTWVNEFSGAWKATPTAKYVVDSVNGSHANAGTCSTSAICKSLSDLPAFSNGDSLDLAANSQFRETLTLTANNMVVSAYGTGTRPLIDGSDVVTTGLFSLVAGKSHTYQFTWTPDPIGGPYFVNAYENGTVMPYALTAGAVETTPGSVFNTTPSCSHSSPCVMYLNPSSNDSPIVNGKVYEADIRDFVCSDGHAVSSISSGHTISGIWCRRSIHNDGSFFGGTSSTIHDVLVTDGGKHNLWPDENDTFTNVVIDGAYQGPVGSGLGISPVIWAWQPTSGTLTFNSVIVTMPASLGCNGFGGHYSTTTTPMTAVNYNYVKVWNCSGGGMEPSLALTGNYLNDEWHGPTNGVIFGSDSATTTFNINGFWAENIYPVLAKFMGGTGAAGSTIRMTNLTVSSTGGNDNLICCGNLTTFQLTNSQISGLSLYLLNGGGVATALISGNILSDYQFAMANTPSPMVSNHNCYNGTRRWSFSGTAYSTLSTFQAAGYELNGTACH